MLSHPAAGEDGFLQASEVVRLKLYAHMVVLSASDTAIGPIGGEEGTLMRQYYARLASQMPADVALAEAQT